LAEVVLLLKLTKQNQMKTKSIIFFLIISLFQFNFLSATEKNRFKNNVIKEFNVRGGLPNFLTKAQCGDSVTVAYLGGSITAQEGYRVLSFKWLQQQFPKSRFRQVNAAIGGTGSRFGVFRLEEQVLKYKPDLVFVEFAVNDAKETREQILRSMEGIVREIWEQNSNTDICFVYTISEPFVDILENRQLPTSVLAMEEVAQHYNIPSINYQVEITKRLQDNSLILKNKDKQIEGVEVFSPDGVHPFIETGHAIYFDILKRSFESLGKKQKGKAHKLAKPLIANFFAHAHMIEPELASFSGEWSMLDTSSIVVSRFKKLIDHVAQSHHTGATLHMKFKGQAIGFCDIMGPNAGRVTVEIDGLMKDTIYRFDKYCTYYRLNNYIVDDLKDTSHEVVFRVIADPIDKEAILKQNGNVIRDTEEFKECSWSVGKILIDGELLP
jgi:lysophospholipase L1-like esterase